MSKRTEASSRNAELDGQWTKNATLPNLIAFLEPANHAIASTPEKHRDANGRPACPLSTAEPAYHAMVRLLDKLLADDADIQKLVERELAAAASELGLRVNAVHQAIAARRLAAWLKNCGRFTEPSGEG